MADCPQYDLELLASLDARDRQGGYLTPAEAMQRLQRQFADDGISPIQVTLRIEPHQIVIVDAVKGVDQEHFHLGSIHQPASVTSNRVAGYDNIVLFTVLQDNAKLQPPELHIFQCLDRPAQDLVHELKAAKEGKLFSNKQHAGGSGRGSGGGSGGAQVRGRPSVVDHMDDDHVASQRLATATISYRPGPAPGAMFRKALNQNVEEISHSEATLRDIEILNHCFDDIEKFVGRLQQAAEAFKELTRRRNNRQGEDSFQGGMLAMRSRPPPVQDFVDIFQKFKLAFNLLAKLKGHIRNPNAPELVHFLFSPLQLVVDTSLDAVAGTPVLASKVLTPPLGAEALTLLSHCMTSGEADLLTSLGPAWNTPRDSWQGPLPPYIPEFFDGWSPPASWLDDYAQRAPQAPTGHIHRHLSDDPARIESRQQEDRSGVLKPVSRALSTSVYPALAPQRGPSSSQPPLRAAGGPGGLGGPGGAGVVSRAPSSARTSQGYSVSQAGLSYEQAQTEYRRVLRSRNAEICVVQNDRTANSDTELSVKKGEILEIRESSGHWWKAVNSLDHVGHVPITILQRLSPSRDPAPDPPHPYQVPRPASFSRLPEYDDPFDPYTEESGNGEVRVLKPRTAVDAINDEFHQRLEMNVAPRYPRAPRGLPAAFVAKDSTPEDVQAWLGVKGFSSRTLYKLTDFTGRQLFALTKSDCETLCGVEEGPRLYSQMLVQKNRSGFQTARSSELEAILRHRRVVSDNTAF